MLIGLYLITPIINNNIPHVSRKTLWITAILLMLFGMFNSSYDMALNNKVFFMLWFVNYLGYFILGYLIKDYKRNFSFLSLSVTYVISSVLIAILSFYTIKRFDSLYFYGYLTPFVITGTLCIYKLFHQLHLGENILSKISHLTLGIYLIHAGVLDAIILLLKTLDITTLNNPVIGIPIKFCVTAFISIILAWTISKMKYVRKII